MRNLDWMDIWGALLVLIVVALLSLGGYAIFQDHSIRFYYMSSQGSGMGRNGYCIDGYREWYSNDQGVFCSDDINKSIAVLKELNSGIKVGK